MLDKTDIASLIEAICKEHREDSESAIEAVLVAARNNRELRDRLLQLGASQIIRDYFRVQRTAAVREPLDPDVFEQRIAERAERRAFLERYSLWGHQMIQDATVKDLEESASKRRAQAEGNLRRADFELAVAKRMGKTRKRCGDVLSNDEVEKLARRFNVA